MKEVFILGAGASASSAMTPLGHELVWRYRQDCGLLLPIRGDGSYDLSEDNVQFADFERFLDIASQIYPELGSELGKWKRRDRDGYNPPRGNKKYYVDEMLRIVQEKGNIEGTKLIRGLIFKHIIGSSFDSQNRLYKEFAAKILKGKLSETVSIISFNFDSLLHEYYESEIYFDYLLDFNWINSNRTYKKQSPIPLIKLHGSFDWGICRKCSELNLYHYSMHEHFYDAITSSSCRKGCGEFTEPFIIIPHQNERIAALWIKAEKELSQADKITIVGYSFPEYDKEVINLFNNSLNDSVEIEVVDQCESNEYKPGKANRIKRRYHNMFPKIKREVKVYLDGFEGYVSNNGIIESQ